MINVLIDENFEEVTPRLSKASAIEEANRCLYCFDAPCMRACPTTINVPSFIKKIASSNLKGSAKVILEANPMGASCARVCPTEELCEGACVLQKDEKPIKIGALQRYATDWLKEQDISLFKRGAANGHKIAIIGSGPAGLSAARELCRLGYEVTIFEAEKQAGGLSQHGIVSFRLPQEVVEWEVDQVRQLGATILTGKRVGIDVTCTELLERFDRIIMAIGMGEVPHLNIEGEKLEGVLDAIDFVKTTKQKPLPMNIQGKKVVVIGAGNTAIDAATCAIRLGAAHVKILYRRTNNEMTAYPFEYEFAKQEGIEFQWLTMPKKIMGNMDGKVVGIECVHMNLMDCYDQQDVLIEVENSNFIVQADVVIRAIGQRRHVDFINEMNLQHLNGVPSVDPITFQTSSPQIYACGDVIYGSGYGDATVVSAVQQGKDCAYALHDALQQTSEIA